MRWIRAYIRSPFWRNVFTLFSGNLLAQAFAVALTPFIARLYVPEAFGLLGVFIAIIAVSVVVVNGGYEWAIMLPAGKGEAHQLLLLSLGLCVLGSLLLLGIGAAFGELLLQWAGSPGLLPWRWLLAFSLLLEGSSQALRMAVNRNEQYRALSMSKVMRSLTQALLSLLLGLGGLGFEGLIYGYVCGQFAGTVMLVAAYWRWLQKEDMACYQPGLWATARQYRDFPRYSVLSTWLHTASRHLPFFLLPVFFSQEINGQFSQADRILSLPVVLLSMSVGHVFFEQASKAKQQSPQALAQITRSTFQQLLKLAIPFLLIVMLLGPDIFAFVLGKEWYLAGEYARWLVPWMAVAFIASPLAYLIDIQRKLKVFLWFNLAFFLLRLLALHLGGHSLSHLGTIQLYGGVSMLLTLLQLAYLLWLGGVWRRGKASPP
ncbi:MAG: hypothetical protein D6730_18870 [Bacteroidetes bacterium]|nr:MAG: hypothetical protein D6730_18870 [Bacteroidota bacterium]